MSRVFPPARRSGCYRCFMLRLERGESVNIRLTERAYPITSTPVIECRGLSRIHSLRSGTARIHAWWHYENFQVQCSLSVLSRRSDSARHLASTSDFAQGANTAKSTKAPEALSKAMFAMGCFWKTQYVFSKVPGVVRTRVGYSGGTVKGPTYEQVCTHTTGHAETALVEYDPKRVSYHRLLEVFFSKHDPTTMNRQGPDEGTQYRSVIFYTTPEQKREALEFKKQLEESHKFKQPIVTIIEPPARFTTPKIIIRTISRSTAKYANNCHSLAVKNFY